MLLLRKLPHKPCTSLPVLTIITRFCTGRNPGLNPGPDPFPDVPTSAYYDDLVHAAGRSGDFDSLLHLLNKRVRDGCFNTSKTFNFITNTETFLSVFEELSQTLARLDKGLPKKNAYDSLISRLCRLGRIDESVRLVHAMAGGGCALNACSFHPILNALTRTRQMERAWGVMKLMRKYHVAPDLTAYNFFLMAHCSVGDLSSAAEVLSGMVGEGLKPDTRTFDALVLGACAAGKVEAAFVVLRRMVDDGVPILLSTHMFVVKELLRIELYTQALEYVKIFSGRDSWLDTNNFGCLASKLIESGRPEEAKMALDEMNARGLKMGDKLMDFYRRKGTPEIERGKFYRKFGF